MYVLVGREVSEPEHEHHVFDDHELKYVHHVFLSDEQGNQIYSEEMVVTNGITIEELDFSHPQKQNPLISSMHLV